MQKQTTNKESIQVYELRLTKKYETKRLIRLIRLVKKKKPQQFVQFNYVKCTNYDDILS